MEAHYHETGRRCCYTYSENLELNAAIKDITAKYTDLSVKTCEICGHKAVHQKSCLRCHQEHWNDSGYFIEDYGEKSNYIKSCQLDIFTDEDDYEKYFKYDQSFEKSPDHKILFSHHDLREYEKIHF
ncbi:hypothetical protein [Chryseobacterium sp. MEBOG07]|uniref:hypothetical protein n=1 Tax=Chryseobacterium sp. MEBOG07 TaxID=2879939 RepID=UPI001F414156|nr:hypothetical protein [Chryseobacterium sp. MEBOG07]UKB81597.1 hypothetical protein LF886_11595 [Chryseobacterium sp. MEBOG07]